MAAHDPAMGNLSADGRASTGEDRYGERSRRAAGVALCGSGASVDECLRPRAATPDAAVAPLPCREGWEGTGLGRVSGADRAPAATRAASGHRSRDGGTPAG